MEANQKRVKAAIYARVSTDKQDTDMQIQDLRRFVDSAGFEIYKEYIDLGFTGSKINRPALNDLMNDARKHKFKAVIVWRFDRFARSTIHMINAMEEFRVLGIDFISRNENIDTRTPLGQAMFVIISVMAQLERDIIRERIKSGMRAAKEKGVKFGRKSFNVDIKDVLYLKNTEKLSIRAIAKRTGVSPSKIYQMLMSYKVDRNESK